MQTFWFVINAVPLNYESIQTGEKMEKTEIESFVRELCKYAGENEAFAGAFCEKLINDEEICREFVYYMEHGNFACQAKVCGYTAVDIMVWQIDHFKAWLDRDTAGTKRNGDRMLLLAFDTLLKMRDEPEKYIQKMQGETGTDFQDKY